MGPTKRKALNEFIEYMLQTNLIERTHLELAALKSIVHRKIAVNVWS